METDILLRTNLAYQKQIIDEKEKEWYKLLKASIPECNTPFYQGFFREHMNFLFGVDAKFEQAEKMRAIKEKMRAAIS